MGLIETFSMMAPVRHRLAGAANISPVRFGLALVAVAMLVGCQAQGLGNAPGDWGAHGFDNAETRSSPLSDISTDTVTRLGVAWHADLTDISGRAFEATPLVVDGVMYVSTGWSNVLAFNAATGEQLWRFDPAVDKAMAGKGCCGPVSRGVAYAQGRIYLAAFDGRLIALDAKSGKQVWTTQTVDTAKDYTITGAPRIVGNTVLIGNAGAELGIRGYVSAYDLATGKLAWRFYTVPPKPGTRDGAASDAVWDRFGTSWAGEWWKLGGGGTVWDSIAYDPDLDLVYIGVGNGGPWNRQMRSLGQGDNLFLGSIIALRPSTGEYVWHFQMTPGDEWDYTSTQSIVLADLELGGKTRKVLMQAPKNGFYYVLDRATGEFLSGTPYVNVTWATGLDPKTGRPRELASSRYSENGAVSVQNPGPLGGHNWQSMSFSKATGLAYIPAIESGFGYVPAAAGYQFHQSAPNMGIDPVATALPEDEAQLEAARAAVHGELIAWDPVARKVAWRVKHPIAWNGGTLATDGGLVFQGTANGDLVAYNARDGRPLWQRNLGTGIVAAPITYKVDGTQYVAIAVGWGGGMVQVAGAVTAKAASTGINRLVVFKLDGTGALPAVPPRQRTVPRLAPGSWDAALVTQGKQLYERRCYHCHGGAVISGGEVPDLRYSATIGDPAAFRAVVRDGALSANGMPAFGSAIDNAGAEAIRAYVAHRVQALAAQSVEK